MHPSKSITNVLKGSSKGVIKDKHVLKSLKALARFNVASLSAGQVGEGIDMVERDWIGQEWVEIRKKTEEFTERNSLVLYPLSSSLLFSSLLFRTVQAVFIASMQLLEGLRVGGSTLDLRPLIPYLGDPNLDVLPQIRYENIIIIRSCIQARTPRLVLTI